jgi:phosphohistidine phosphatase SixA
MALFLFRHGDKAKTWDADPPLSEKGLLQAEALASLVERGDLPTPHQVIASPRKRAQQTLLPTSQVAQLTLTIADDLYERQPHENSELFNRRIKKFLTQLPQRLNANSNLYLCSHMDWLEEALLLLDSDTDFNLRPIFWAPCQYVEFEWQDGIWIFKKSRQVNP